MTGERPSLLLVVVLVVSSNKGLSPSQGLAHTCWASSVLILHERSFLGCRAGAAWLHQQRPSEERLLAAVLVVLKVSIILKVSVNRKVPAVLKVSGEGAGWEVYDAAAATAPLEQVLLSLVLS